MHTPPTWPGLSSVPRTGDDELVQFCLLLQGQEFELRPGEYVIGRGSGCDIAVEDMLASRMHAKLLVSERLVIVQDLDSTNGVYVNEMRIKQPTALRVGDRLLIGKQELSLFATTRQASARRDDRPTLPGKRSAPTTKVPAVNQRSVTQTFGATSGVLPATEKVDALIVLGRVAERAVQEGRLEAAERVLRGHVETLVAGAREGRPLAPHVLLAAARYGLMLAQACTNSAWVDAVIELHLIAKRPLTEPHIEKLEALIPALPNVDVDLFRMYQAVLRSSYEQFSAVDRALAERIFCLTVPAQP